MSENKTLRTPGPWQLDKYGTGILDARGFSIGDADETGVLQDWDKTGAQHWSRRHGETYIERSEEEAEANARLMVAAPELLEACKAVVAANSNSQRREALELCAAAIAKAECKQ